jgi:Na+-transporting methylmalonyl-CoA/oxaloacetate decarboxylase gamma subunit
MSDFTGMGGALTVCVIAQSIVFIALAIMAGVIFMVGIVAGEKNNSSQPLPLTMPVQQTGQPGEEEEEIAVAVMGALSAELGTEPGSPPAVQPVRNTTGPGSSWRIVSLQEAAQRSSLK